MENFKKLYSILPDKIKKKLLFFLILLLLSTIFEIMNIGLIYPILNFLINGETSVLYLKINEFIGISFKDTVILLIIIFLILIFIKFLFQIFYSVWSNRMNQKVYKYLSSTLLSIYLNKDYLVFINKNSSELIRDISLETRNISSCIFLYLKMIVEISIFIGIVFMLLLINFKTTIFLLSFFSFLTIGYYLIVKNRLFSFGQIKINYNSQLLQSLQEIIGSIKDIKLKGNNNFFINNYLRKLSQFTKASYKTSVISDIPKLFLEFFFSFILMVFVLYSLIYSDIKNSLIIVSLYAVAGLRVLPGISRLAYFAQTLKHYSPSINLITSIFEDNKQAQQSVSDKVYCKKIRFEKLSVSSLNYSYGDKNILKNINFEIDKNSLIGIAGPSGSGKSTLLNLLMGFLRPNSGSINFDEKNIFSNLNDWQRSIGYVPQSIYLLDSTLLENIAFGVEKKIINQEKINSALQDARLNTFINTLDEGVNTIIGEKGSKLSGGQIQRIAIARELYREPSLLILDEATNALDADTERDIIETLIRLKNKITIIIVSHKQSTLNFCDKVISI